MTLRSGAYCKDCVGEFQQEPQFSVNKWSDFSPRIAETKLLAHLRTKMMSY